MTARDTITDLLSELHSGKDRDGRNLMPAVYGHLRQIAERHCAGEWQYRTLRPSDLLHETYLRLIKPGKGPWQNRSHFFAVASSAMREVLVDYARARGAKKRGGAQKRLELDKLTLSTQIELLDVLAVDQALRRLAKLSRRQSRVVELRFFGGLTLQETAAALRISPTVVKSDWTLAKAYLRRELQSVR